MAQSGVESPYAWLDDGYEERALVGGLGDAAGGDEPIVVLSSTAQLTLVQQFIHHNYVITYKGQSQQPSNPRDVLPLLLQQISCSTNPLTCASVKSSRNVN